MTDFGYNGWIESRQQSVRVRVRVRVRFISDVYQMMMSPSGWRTKLMRSTREQQKVICWSGSNKRILVLLCYWQHCYNCYYYWQHCYSCYYYWQHCYNCYCYWQHCYNCYYYWQHCFNCYYYWQHCYSCCYVTRWQCNSHKSHRVDNHLRKFQRLNQWKSIGKPSPKSDNLLSRSAFYVIFVDNFHLH